MAGHCPDIKIPYNPMAHTPSVLGDHPALWRLSRSFHLLSCCSLKYCLALLVLHCNSACSFPVPPACTGVFICHRKSVATWLLCMSPWEAPGWWPERGIMAQSTITESSSFYEPWGLQSSLTTACPPPPALMPAAVVIWLGWETSL